MYKNQELLDVQAGFRKSRRTRAPVATIVEKAREFQKSIYLLVVDYAKVFDCVDHNKLWEILQELGVPAHHTCLLRNLYACQEAIVRSGHGTMDWFKTGKGMQQAVYCHSVYLTSMKNTSC